MAISKQADGEEKILSRDKHQLGSLDCPNLLHIAEIEI